MVRLCYLVFSVILLFSLLSDATTKTVKKNRSSCLKCHEQVLMKAIANPFQHSVVQDSCKVCHQVEARVEQKKSVLWSQTFQPEGTVFIGNLEPHKQYKVIAEVLDSFGNKSTLQNITIKPSKILNSFVNTSPLEQISNVRLDKLTKGLFVEATIAWNTNVPATTEIEYKMIKGESKRKEKWKGKGRAKRKAKGKGKGKAKYRKMSSAGNLFTNEHSLAFNGLRHKSTYQYRIVSRDISGNILKSSEYTLNTSDATAPVEISEELKELPTLITNLRVLKNEKKNDFYIKIAANKNVQFKIWLKDIDENSDRPCLNFKQNRYSTIDVCIKCHAQDSSHPVGVRSKNPKIVVSDNLPTIENGMITCVTCHYSHGGKKQYYLRVNFTEEICAKCHQSYYKY